MSRPRFYFGSNRFEFEEEGRVIRAAAHYAA